MLISAVSGLIDEPRAQQKPEIDRELRQGIAVQVALDRAGFSPGVIDGKPGPNTDRAMAALKGAQPGSAPELRMDEPLTTYTITAEDAAGPFAEVPEDMMAKAELAVLGYSSLVELLSERFHTTPELLKQLNPTARFAAHEAITVPNVEPFTLPKPQTAQRAPATGRAANTSPDAPSTRGGSPDPTAHEAVTVVVTGRSRTLQVQSATGAVLFHAPVTVGSENDPLPVGDWKVNGVRRLPVFHYSPELFWDADPAHAKATVAPGPNNPVGVVWIDLSKEHYGMHGTPDPERVGHTHSHGCIRLTNWDAMRVAALVRPGTRVVLR